MSAYKNAIPKQSLLVNKFVTMYRKSFKFFLQKREKTLDFQYVVWYHILSKTATRYALKREVAAILCSVFPWSMSDFKPGERIFDVMVKDQSALCVNCDPDGHCGRLYLATTHDAFVTI